MDPAFLPGALFDLEGFAFSELFPPETPVWEALRRIGEHLARAGRSAIEGTVASGAWIEGPNVFIGAGTVVEPGAYIQGPCYIGRRSEVRHGAYLRGNVIVGDHAVVGHATEVKNSIFLDGAKAGHFAYVGDSILGRDVNLGAGTKLANLRLDGAAVRVGGVETGLRKLGAVLGDGVETGCNSVLNPGTVLGRGARVYSCASISGAHPPGAVLGERPLSGGTLPRGR